MIYKTTREMSRLIIHVGPPKCGSSTIQSFLKKKPFKEKVKFSRITGKVINSFLEDSNFEKYKDYIKRLKKDLKSNDAVVISHENLFGNTTIIESICRLTKPNDVRIVGYSRKPSGFLISAFSQWDFRCKESYDFYSQFINQNINPVFFTGLESFIISIVLSDFNSELSDPRFKVYDWNYYYKEIKKSIPECKLFVNCLPSKDYQYNLIQDFCNKANLSVKKRKQSFVTQSSNLRFDATLTESIFNSLALKMNVPNGRYHNFFLEDLSLKLGQNKGQKNVLLEQLSDYIDSVFFESNKELCEEYEISLKEYEPGIIIDKYEIKEIINKEYEIRKQNPEEIISFYKEMTGRWAHFHYYSYYEQVVNKIPVLSKHLIKYLFRV